MLSSIHHRITLLQENIKKLKPERNHIKEQFGTVRALQQRLTSKIIENECRRNSIELFIAENNCYISEGIQASAIESKSIKSSVASSSAMINSENCAYSNLDLQHATREEKLHNSGYVISHEDSHSREDRESHGLVDSLMLQNLEGQRMQKASTKYEDSEKKSIHSTKCTGDCPQEAERLRSQLKRMNQTFQSYVALTQEKTREQEAMFNQKEEWYKDNMRLLKQNKKRRGETIGRLQECIDAMRLNGSIRAGVIPVMIAALETSHLPLEQRLDAVVGATEASIGENSGTLCTHACMQLVWGHECIHCVYSFLHYILSYNI